MWFSWDQGLIFRLSKQKLLNWHIFTGAPTSHLTIQCRLDAMRRTSHPTDIDPPLGPVRQWFGEAAATCGTGSWRGAWRRWQMHFWIRRHIPKPWKVCGLKLQIYGIVSSNIWRTERWNMKDIRTQKVEIKSRLRQIRNHPSSIGLESCKNFVKKEQLVLWKSMRFALLLRHWVRTQMSSNQLWGQSFFQMVPLRERDVALRKQRSIPLAQLP